jgi:hypothetical protein
VIPWNRRGLGGFLIEKWRRKSGNWFDERVNRLAAWCPYLYYEISPIFPCIFLDFPHFSPTLLCDKYSRCFPIIWILPYSNTKENLPSLHFSPISTQTTGFGNLNLSHPNWQSPGRTGIRTEIYRQLIETRDLFRDFKICQGKTKLTSDEHCVYLFDNCKLVWIELVRDLYWKQLILQIFWLAATNLQLDETANVWGREVGERVWKNWLDSDPIWLKCCAERGGQPQWPPRLRCAAGALRVLCSIA